MSPVGVGGIVLACVLGGTLAGIAIRATLPEHHLREDSKEVVKLATGLIATMTALLLGLVTASAKSSFDAQDASVKRIVADILALDRVLARYGEETRGIREEVRRAVEFPLAAVWSTGGGARAARKDAPEMTRLTESLEDRIRDLAPRNEGQRRLRSEAEDLIREALRIRWLVFGSVVSAIPVAFLVVLVSWLSLTFASFGLFAPRNGTVLTALFLCALSVSGAVFLILELDDPFDGWIKVSGDPMRYAVSQLGR